MDAGSRDLLTYGAVGSPVRCNLEKTALRRVLIADHTALAARLSANP